MKKIFYILVLSLFIFNCSNSDNDGSNMTFLAKYEGTVWVYSDSGEKTYARIINNLNSPFEFWIELGNCYYYFLETLDDGYYSGFTITKNSNDTFEVKFIENDGEVEYIDLVTVNVSGSSMEINSEYYEDGNLTDSYSEFYTKTSIDLDSFILCD